MNKISCGGFNIGDGLTLDKATNTLSANGGGSGGVQPDYNQNDVTALDYIKNRPFYTDDSKMTTLYDETLPFSVSSYKSDVYQTENNAFSITFPSEAVAANPIISWDGVDYSCKLIKDNIVGYGNIGMFNPSYDNTGEPFALIITDLKQYTAFTKSTASSHRIAIKDSSTAIKKIDDKYLPMISAENTNVAGIISIDNVEVIANEAISYYMRNTNVRVYNNASLGLTVEEANTVNNPQRIFIPNLIPTGNAVLNGEYKYGDTDDDFTVDVVTAQGDAVNCYSGVGKSNSPFLSWRIDKTGIIIPSSTSGSTKKFKITVDDSGTLTATEYNE